MTDQIKKTEAATDAALMAVIGPFRDAVDRQLALLASTWDGPGELAEAMRHAVLGGGKRIRPALVMATCNAAGGIAPLSTPFATALELVHAYSLVHDDLPAMDNDVLRRGQPTVHVKYGEDMAILVGDALLTEAFRVAADDGQLNDTQRVAAIRILANAAGQYGMVGGQVRDIRHLAKDADSLRVMHAEKTGALFAAACQLGAVAAGLDAGRVAALKELGAAIGAAFQISDDVIDYLEMADAGAADHEQQVNLVSMIGVEAAVRATLAEVKRARAVLETLPVDNLLLLGVIDWIAGRVEQFASIGDAAGSPVGTGEH